MTFKKTIQFLGFVFCLFISSQLFAQNPGWVTCGSSAGTFDGNTNNIYLSDTTPVPTFVSAPSPTSALPNTEFLIVLKNSLAVDSLGDEILVADPDGQVSPQDLGLSVGDTFSIVAFSYDLLQVKATIQALLNNMAIPFPPISCCDAIDLVAPVPGLCDSLNAAGIYDSTDVNNMNDMLAFLAAFGEGGSSSLRGLNAILVGVNAQLGAAPANCTNSTTEICYAMDSLWQNQAHYAVTTMVNTQNVEGTSALQIAVSPNPFMDYIATGIMSEMGGEHTLRVFDATGRTVHQEVKMLAAGEQLVRMELGNLPAGLYYLQVSDLTNIATQKIIKR